MIQPLHTLIRDYTGDVDPTTGLPAVDRTERVEDARRRRVGELLSVALREMTELLQSQGLDAPTAQALAASQLASILPASTRSAMSDKVANLRLRLAAAITMLKVAGSPDDVDDVKL